MLGPRGKQNPLFFTRISSMPMYMHDDDHASSSEADVTGTLDPRISILFGKLMSIALDPGIDEGGWDADGEESYVDEAASPWSDVTYE